MEKELRTRLAQPFPDSYIRQRKGSFGKTLNYLAASAVIERLNDCFDNEWTFVIVTHEVLVTGEVLVHGRLTALGISKDAFGRGQQAVNRDTGEVISAADAYKSAVSDCIKRCARLLGVGAYLYSDDPAEDAVPAQPNRKVKDIKDGRDGKDGRNTKPEYKATTRPPPGRRSAATPVKQFERL